MSTTIKVIKLNGMLEDYNPVKIKKAMKLAFKDANIKWDKKIYYEVLDSIDDEAPDFNFEVPIWHIQDTIECILGRHYNDVAKKYILYRSQRDRVREWVKIKEDFIEKYKASSNTADATIDDNSNIASKNIGILNNEIHKPDNIEINRKMVTNKIKDLWPDFDYKQYVRDLNSHIIYKHDESSFAGAIAPYCCSISMYPFISTGIKGVGGLSSAPKNIDSFCGMYINLIFAIGSQFAGAIATSEFLLYFDWFARKEWGDDYYMRSDDIISIGCRHQKTIMSQIKQYFQQVIYSINQPVGARGNQAAFVNFSYFDKPFFDGMFSGFVFPDNTTPKWDSLSWLQKTFMMWLNEERTKCILTFPVESFALVYKDGNFVDQESANFVAEEYGRGHSFFTYISDTVDSLSSCCRLKNVISGNEFNFTNGNIGIMTGSKSVITINLNRIVQNIYRSGLIKDKFNMFSATDTENLTNSLRDILSRIYKYHIAYNEILYDLKDAKLLPTYTSHFIDLGKQYLTIGINGLNQAAEFLGIDCTDNEDYQSFCKTIFSCIRNSNKENGKLYSDLFKKNISFNTEQVPAESLAIKNYNWDKEDGYVVPQDTNLYASYIFKPNDSRLSVLEKIRMHGSKYIGDYLDGGAAAHINLEEHLDVEQYKKLLKHAAEVGCQYFTFNVPNSECENCGWIGKSKVDVCPVCGSTNISLWDRVIGYLTKIKNWSVGRRIEQSKRIYSNKID